MTHSPASLVVDAYCQTHRRMLAFLQKLSDEQLHWRLNADSHSIAFHAWHTARWADHLQAAIPGMTLELGRRLGPGVEIWQEEGLAERWGFQADALGYRDTGMRMPDEIAMRLPFPAKDALLDYVARVFDRVERATRMIDDEQFLSAEQPQPLTEGIWGGSTVGAALIGHVTHANRHFGMMECLLGFQGQPGTATQ